MAGQQPAPFTAHLDPQHRDRVFRRVVLRTVPFITVVYVIAWMDRVNVGFAKLTMLDDLSWSETVYGAGAGIFFLGYFLFEVPSNLLLERIGARRTIMRIAVGWGVVSVLMAWVSQPWHFYALRFLQGAFEAGLHPGIILYLTYWLPAHRRGKAVAICMSASPLAMLVGSPLAGFLMKHTDGLLGKADWQWLFIIEGIPSVVLGLLAFFLLTDRPRDATWLSVEERAYVEAELSRETARLSGREHSLRAILRLRTTWVLILSLYCIITGNATLSFYGPSLVADAGFTDLADLGWVMSGIFALGWTGMLVNGWWSDHAARSTSAHGVGRGGRGAGPDSGRRRAADGQLPRSPRGPGPLGRRNHGIDPRVLEPPAALHVGNGARRGRRTHQLLCEPCRLFRTAVPRRHEGEHGLLCPGSVRHRRGGTHRRGPHLRVHPEGAMRRSPQLRRTPRRPMRSCPEVPYTGRLLKQPKHPAAVYRKWDPKY